jgi:hypothetical protein
MLSIAATLAFAVLAMAPGWQVMRGRELHPGIVSAAMAASLVLVMLASALIGIAVNIASGAQLPAPVMAPVALGSIAAVSFAARQRGPHSPGAASHWAPIEWEGLAIGILFSAFGLFSLDLAIAETRDGGLFVHSWYNADWFKHIGHVHALANYGLPARDIFGGGSRLYYYWLFYVLPGSGSAIGGDSWAALSTANAVITMLFAATLYGLVRLVAKRRIALVVTALALFATAPIGFFLAGVFGDGLQALLDMPQAPKGPALLSISQFIPQHALAATLFMSWALLARVEKREGARLAWAMALVALASVLTISTLLGATLLIAYGLAELYRRRLSAVPELSGMVIASGLFAAALAVIQLANPDSALESPLLDNSEDLRPWFERAGGALMQLFGFCGPPLSIALFLLIRWKPQEPEALFARIVSLCLIASSVLAVAATQIIAPERLAVETLIRAVIPAAIGVALVWGWAAASGWQAGGRLRTITVAAGVALAVLALPCVYVRTTWMADFDDDYTTFVPAVDRAILSQLRRLSEPEDLVWQYPETPVLAQSRGDDNWSVIFAGRTVPNSERATDFDPAARSIELSRRFFEGEAVTVPRTIDWVYLSRNLKPDGFDAARANLRAHPAWKEVQCYEDACLFSRRESIRP